MPTDPGFEIKKSAWDFGIRDLGIEIPICRRELMMLLLWVIRLVNDTNVWEYVE